MLALIAASELFLPWWMEEFVTGIGPTADTQGILSLFYLLLGPTGAALNIGVVASAGFLGWKMRRKPVASREFALAFCTILVATVVAMPALYPTYQVVLLPAIFLLLQEWRTMWASGCAAGLALFACGCLTLWPWVGASRALLIAKGFQSLSQIRKFWIVPVIPFP